MTMLTTLDPTTGRQLERVAVHTTVDIDRRLDSAMRTASSWRELPVSERALRLRALGERLRAEREVLASTAVREMGKPIEQARAEIDKCAACCEYFAGNAAQMLTPVPVPCGTGGYIAFRPLGVIFAIMPWNFPFWQVVRAAIPALAAGNVVVLKHAENTTRCGLECERVMTASGMPHGAFTTLLIDNDVADRLIADPRIAGVTLTGSERAGVAVAQAAAQAIKKCVLELGGSDAFIVLDDADIEGAVAAAIAARFQNNGQSCIAAKRFIVTEPHYDRFVDAFAQGTQALRIGEPMQPETQLGPLARASLRATLDEQVQASLRAGARLACGGHAIDRPGFFYEPTVLSEVRPGMRVFDEETFGPAAAIVRARDADDALALANASQFGLGCAIWTEDTARAERLAAGIEAGSVFVNGIVASDPGLPFGGVKKSGYGRELSAFGIHEFTNVQTVRIATRAAS